MNEPVLVIMAAGMGSRYGGLKQIDPIDEYGNIIIDYSIYDAIRAGFKKIIFIIKHNDEADFMDVIGNRIKKYVDVQFAFQELDNLPDGYRVPEGRTKPWGTGHAIACVHKLVDGPFLVINADDYYGSSSFEKAFRYLKNAKDEDTYDYMMIAYQLGNTMTENGHVARGICQVDADGYLTRVDERTHIEYVNGIPMYLEDNGKTWVELSKDASVSMNMWGFTQSILDELDVRFRTFLDINLKKNPLKCEYFLPFVVNELLIENKAKVKVLKSEDRWYGVTYKADKNNVVSAIRNLKNEGRYSEKLWQE